MSEKNAVPSTNGDPTKWYRWSLESQNHQPSLEHRQGLQEEDVLRNQHGLCDQPTHHNLHEQPTAVPVSIQNTFMQRPHYNDTSPALPLVGHQLLDVAQCICFVKRVFPETYGRGKEIDSTYFALDECLTDKFRQSGKPSSAATKHDISFSKFKSLLDTDLDFVEPHELLSFYISQDGGGERRFKIRSAANFRAATLLLRLGKVDAFYVERVST